MAAGARWDDSVVLGGFTYRSVETTFGEDEWITDFLAIALDEDGNELWRWQVTFTWTTAYQAPLYSWIIKYSE